MPHTQPTVQVVLTAGEQSPLAEALRGALSAAGMSVHISGDSRGAAEHLTAAEDGSEAPAALLIGLEPHRAVAVARQAHAASPTPYTIFLARGEEAASLQRELGVAPRIGTLWSIADPNDPSLPKIVSDAAASSRQRRQFRTTLDRMNLRISARSLIDSREYRRLVASDRYLADILRHAHDAIISLDPGAIVTSWNDGAERLLGISRSHAVGQPAERLVEWPAEFADLLRRASEGATVAGEETECRIGDRSLNLELTFSPVVDEGRGLIGTTLIVRDVTERRLAEQERERLLASEQVAREEAERASQMKDEFLATLSHELRTPLNAILGWATLLRQSRSAADAEDADQGLEVIERSARVQAQIIEDLLDMSRIISGKVRLDVQRIDLASVVNAAVETVRPAAEAKQIRLQVVLDPHAGPVSGDPNRLQQVFWNLLSNAVKFTPKRGKVQVLLERVNSHLEVSVIDTGEGIAPEFLPHVFDRFRQADSTTMRRHGGLGIGLSIVKQLIELHGGEVRVKSGGEGQGATFTVTLPLTVVHPEPDLDAKRRHPRTGASQAGESAFQVHLDGVTVLVVDDEPDARALIKRVLEGRNAIVQVAASAAEAVELVRSERPDVLVSDIGMPGEDGYDLIQKVRALGGERGGGVPAVALTAYARSEDRTKAVLAGYQMHIAKPVEPSELIALVASLSGRAGVRSEEQHHSTEVRSGGSRERGCP